MKKSGGKYFRLFKLSKLAYFSVNKWRLLNLLAPLYILKYAHVFFIYKFHYSGTKFYEALCFQFIALNKKWHLLLKRAAQGGNTKDKRTSRDKVKVG